MRVLVVEDDPLMAEAIRDPTSVALTVESTGAELALQLATTLTEPFQRGTQRRQGDQAGVGLGLAIVRSIAEAHDGTLVLTPREGGGLEVTVRLPTPPQV